MARIIINYPDDVDEAYAVALVGSVIDGGRVSGTGDRKQFCYASLTNRFAVYASLRKSGTDTFDIIHRED